MRILHVIPSYYPATQFGGTATATHSLCEALAEVGEDVEVLTTNRGLETELPDGGEVTHGSVRVTYLRACRPNSLFGARALLERLESAVREADVVHSHGLFLLPTLSAHLVSQVLGVPSVVSPRGMLMNAAIGSKRRRLKQAWIRTVEYPRLALSHLHFVTEFERSESAKVFPRSASGFVLPFGVALDSPATCDFPKTLVLGYLGRLAPEKNLEALLSVTSSLNVPVVLAGGGDDAYVQHLKAIGGATAMFLGELSPDHRWKLFEQISVLVLTSHFESFGNAAIEAMAAARPVLVGYSVGSAEFVKEAAAGFVTETDSESLMRTIRELEELPRSDLAAAGKRGAEFVRMRLSWPLVAAKFVEHYRQAAKQRMDQV